MLVGLLERLESVKSEDEPPYDEVERELQRALDEEVKEVGDVGKTLSECVTEFMEGNDELKRKLNDKPPTAEEREREREEREKKRKERREQRQHDGRPHHHSVDLTIDTKRYTPNTSASSTTQQLPLPPTASPPTIRQPASLRLASTFAISCRCITGARCGRFGRSYEYTHVAATVAV